MISLDIHGVKSISARYGSHGPANNWVKLEFVGPPAHFEFIVFFDRDKLAAEAYAAAINGAKPVIPVDEQRAA